jgi:hypothetical protein
MIETNPPAGCFVIMTQSTIVRFRRLALGATAMLLSAASVAHAQDQRRASDVVEPWHAPAHEPAPAHATSSLEATQTTAATLTQQRETRTLATAVFAKPAAAQRAADKAAEAYEPAIPPAAPKDEWLDDGVHLGGKKLFQLTAPF